MEFLRQPWTWYAAGIIIGLIVPALLILGNKHFGISSNMRHICAACFPANIAYFELAGYGITDFSGSVPKQLFSFESLFTLRGLIMMVAGGFLVGFGTRYAGGCTSGHSIMGLSNLQLPSFIATCCFMAGGFIMANLILPFILRL